MSAGRYLARHWRGELSLPMAYWVNGVVLAPGAVWLLTAMLRAIPADTASLKTVALVSLLLILFVMAATLWSLVGIWRAASRYRAAGGPCVWALLAQLAAAAGLAALSVRTLHSALPQARAYLQIVLGDDPIGPVDVAITPDGRTLTLRGALREGAADKVLAALARGPQLTAVMLHSGGGRLFEAQKIAAAVRARGLDTFVEFRCESACTYVFLAGRQRAATPNAKIGFHQPSFPGVDGAAQQAMTRQMLDFYREASLPEAFINHIEGTPPDQIWYPTRDELIDAHVVTRLTLGGESTAVLSQIHSKKELMLVLQASALQAAYEQRFPGSLQRTADSAWQAKVQGGSDSAILSAARAVTAQYNARLLAGVDDTARAAYATLALEQLQAAQRVSPAACAGLLKGRLDVTKVLPAALSVREQAWLMKALAAPPTATAAVDKAQVAAAWQAMRAAVPPLLFEAAVSPDQHQDPPGLVCSAYIAIYQTALSLPAPQRNVALHALMAGGL